MQKSIQDILCTVKTIAVVGCSRDQNKDAHSVPAFLKSVGYNVIPINPNADSILNETSFDSLADASSNVEAIDLVDVFRPSDTVFPIVRDAVNVGVNIVWMQLGITHEEAAEYARDNGVDVIENKCIKQEYTKRWGNNSLSKLD